MIGDDYDDNDDVGSILIKMNRPKFCGNDDMVSGCFKILNKFVSNLSLIISACWEI
jgi:hypothetical protein